MTSSPRRWLDPSLEEAGSVVPAVLSSPAWSPRAQLPIQPAVTNH